ncbi:MAG: metallophosphoesterase [bacterium]|nr:metallophosphoesterase [bacterium]
MKVGFVTDIHEDIINLENAFRILDEQNCDKNICLGDIVGFTIPFYKNITTRDADACVKAVKNNCSHYVIGNHDLFAIKKTPANTAGFNYGENWYSLDYETRSRLARNKIWLYEDGEIPCDLSDESIEFLESLRETDVVDLLDQPIFISHFCHPDFTGSHIHFPSEGAHLKNHFAFAEAQNCTLSFSGHGHPEGCLIGTSEKIINNGFGKHTINKQEQWIVAPSIARTNRKNGVLIFDSIELQLTILPLTK